MTARPTDLRIAMWRSIDPLGERNRASKRTAREPAFVGGRPGVGTRHLERDPHGIERATGMDVVRAAERGNESLDGRYRHAQSNSKCGIVHGCTSRLPSDRPGPLALHHDLERPRLAGNTPQESACLKHLDHAVDRRWRRHEVATYVLKRRRNAVAVRERGDECEILSLPRSWPLRSAP